ncbi:MAG: hypothetical protein QUS14_18640 [Pyrinomonadaceae bacterium]|nr:hypothetical protein [Pyrinomonadaceae bacterium]
MPKKLKLSVPADFSFRHTVQSHGWYDLRPFELSAACDELHYVFRDPDSGQIASGRIRESGGKLTVSLTDEISAEGVKRDVRHILRLDDRIEDFYDLAAKDGVLAWAAANRAGRLLRSATVFEDLIKTLCTTNCSWALTKSMTNNLVSTLGEETSDGRRAFPTPSAMAGMNADFYRNEIRAGYRSPYFVELADAVAAGKIRTDEWLDPELPTSELRKQLKAIKGIGDYAADNMLKLLGRYDGLALDSWLRAQFYKKHNRGRKCPDKKIERHYAKYGDWKGLAIWCDMTEDWFTA